MSAIVVKVDPSHNGEVALQVDAPFNLGARFNPHFTEIVTLTGVTSVAGPDFVRQIGKRLVAILHKNHTIREVLRTALTLQNAPPSQPIFFRVGDTHAHQLSWEALYRNRTFLALDKRWPIARLPRGGDPTDTDPIRRAFAPPLRLVCVLSAIGAEARKEWDGIYAAVKAVRERLPIHVTLLVGEQELLDEVNKVRDPLLTVAPVPPASDICPLVDRIRELQPHILHMFCHGKIDDGGVNILDVATITDFEAGAKRGSVQIRAQELGAELNNPQSWCVVLNVCRGADASAPLTHAEIIVSAGVPVAVGMRRQIEENDANAFSAAFYPSIFNAIAAATNASAPSRQIDWADTLLSARRRLRDLHDGDPSTDDSWTIPVLYTWSRPFTVDVVAPDNTSREMERASETNVVDGLVNIIGENAPASVIDDLLR